MNKQRVILANGSRLLREMLKRIFRKSDHLEVVQEITDHHNLSSAIERLDAEWVIMSPEQDQTMPSWVDKYMLKHPQVRFLTVSNDGSQVKMKWLDKQEKTLSGLSLKDLLYILEQQTN
jgi:chemotaxis response regulator CheB